MPQAPPLSTLIVHVLANTHVFIRMIWNVINTRVKGVQWTYTFGTVLITQLDSSEHQRAKLSRDQSGCNSTSIHIVLSSSSRRR